MSESSEESEDNGVNLKVIKHIYTIILVLSIASVAGSITVNPEIFARILISRMALKDIFATFKIRDEGMIYQYQ